MPQLHLSEAHLEERYILAHPKKAAKTKLQHASGQLSHQFSPPGNLPCAFCSPHSNQSLKLICLFLFAASRKIKRKGSDYNSMCKQLALEEHAQTNISSEIILEKKIIRKLTLLTSIRNINFPSVILFVLYIFLINNNQRHFQGSSMTPVQYANMHYFT